MNVSAVRAMALGLSVASCVVFPGTAGVTAQQASTSIAQQMHDTGSFERIVVTTYDPLSLSALAGRADLIVEASTEGGRSRLNAAETDIVTDYTFVTHAVIKNKRIPGFRAGNAITVRRDSGVVVMDGRTAVTHENGFPAFNASEHYILFLMEQPGDKTYSVVGGPQGAFRADENITTIGVSVNDAPDSPHPVSRAAFMGELRALLHFSSY
jgi:hypothetical protein